MKKLIRFIVFILVIAGALAFFKPTEKNFEDWVKKEAAEKRGNAKGENVIEKLVDKGITTATQLQILGTYQYNNHYVLSIVKANANGEQLQYLGIAGFWVQLPNFK